MKVKQLIAKLKKMPQDLEVYTADHDHSDWEVSSHVNSVVLSDKSRMTKADIENHTTTINHKDELDLLPNRFVQIRP